MIYEFIEFMNVFLNDILMNGLCCFCKSLFVVMFCFRPIGSLKNTTAEKQVREEKQTYFMTFLLLS